MRSRSRRDYDAVPGTGVITAQDVIAEIGTDMTVFPSAAHLVSWAKWCPQVAQSGGKRKGANASGRGNRYLGAALGEAAASAGRTRSFPGAKYRRLVKRMPKKKALVATGNSLLTIYHALLSDPQAVYTDLGTDYYQRRASTPPPGPQPHPRPGTPRLPRHHRAHRPRHRRTPSSRKLTRPTPGRRLRRRPLPRAQPRFYFRTR